MVNFVNPDYDQTAPEADRSRFTLFEQVYICLNILNKIGNHINILVHRLTLCLRVSSADTFANRFDPDQAIHKVGPDLDSNC